MAGVCVGSGACTDSRACPLGYACEAGACVDRRIRCSTDGNCPFGYTCDSSLDRGTCVRLSRRCASDLACTSTIPDPQVCVDIDGDGMRECQFAGGVCVTNAMCSAAGVTCTPFALTGQSTCGRYGPCASVADCAAGQMCVDLWGDGVRECVNPGGSCARTADCPVGRVCATPSGGGSPACLVAG
jgi:hypothetical protein